MKESLILKTREIEDLQDKDREIEENASRQLDELEDLK